MDKVKSSEFLPVYDPIQDISPVDQFGFIDLREAFINHSIPGDLQSDVDSFNGVEDPDSLLGSPKDVFEAYRKAEYVKSAVSASDKGAASAAAKAEASAASSAASE